MKGEPRRNGHANRHLKIGQGLLFFFLLLLFLVLAGGCWDRRELENLAVVLGIGVHLPARGEGYEVSFQIVRAAQIQGPTGETGGGGGTIKPVWILRTSGPTVFEAVRNATLQSSRRLFLAHNQAVIISTEVAQKGIMPALDFFLRDHESRSIQWLLLTPADPVEVLDAAAGLERVSALAINDLIEDYRSTSKIRPVNIGNYMETAMQKTSANTLPIIRVKETAGKRELLMDGTGVVKDDRLVGALNAKETRGLLWVLGEVKGGVNTVDLPDGAKATLEIFTAATKVKVEAIEEKVRVGIEVKVQSSLGAQTTTDDLSTPGQIKKLAALQGQVIEDEIRAALRKAKEYKADIFGFGEYLFKHDFPAWQRLVKEWERHFAGAEVEIKVEVQVENLGLVTRPAFPKETGEK